MSEGVKFDEGKPQLSLLPDGPLEAIARVLEFGMKKYSRDNWRGGMDWNRLIDATLRHIHAWNDGEDNAEDSGLNHLAHAACNLMFLLEYKGTYPEGEYRPGRVENRPKPINSNQIEMPLILDRAEVWNKAKWEREQK